MRLRSSASSARRRVFSASAALAVIAIAVSGCGLGAAKAKQADGPLTNDKAIANLAQPPAKPDPNAKPGGILKLTMSQDPLCLDGAQVSSAAMQLIGRLIYDNLDALNAQGVPTPWLATSWTITNGGKTYTFQLRKGVTFSDGTPFNAAAVVANFDHWRNPATKSPLAGDYIQPIKDTKIEGPYTLRVDLDYPYSAFLNVLAQGWLGFISPRQLATQSDSEICQDPIGTGPFVVDKYIQSESLDVSRRQGYDWSASYLNHKGPAYLAGVDISFVTEDSVLYSSLVSGEYDATDTVAPQYAAEIEANPDIIYHNIARQGNPERIILNTARAPFSDIRVRQALAEGINVDGIVQTVGYGQYQPEHAFLSPTTADSDEAGAQKRYKYDPAAAKKLLDEAGWSKFNAQGYRVNAQGKQLTAYEPVGQSSSPSPLTALIQSQFKALGIDLVLQEVTSAEAASDLATGNYDVTGGVWHTNTPDGLYVCYDGTQIRTPTYVGQNVSRLNNPQLNAVLLAARQTTNPAQEKTLYYEAEVLLEKLVPAIPLYDFYTAWAVRKNVHDVLADSSHGVPLFTIAWMSQ